MTSVGVPPMSGSELPLLEGSAVQRRLAGAAIELFARQGSMSTSVREITQACGITPGALYNHFSSKEELLYTLVRELHLRLEREVAEAQAVVAGDPVAELTAIVTVYVAEHANARPGSRVANREYRALTGEWFEEIVTIRRRLRNRVVGVLCEGQRSGAFSLTGGADSAGVVALAILDMCVHVSEWFREGRPMTRAELQAQYVQLALRMVGAA